MKNIPQVRSRKNERDKYKVIKALTLAVLILVSVEGVLWILEANQLLDEPYLWGSRQKIGIKINHCIDLFSQPENIEKLKIIAIGDSFCVTGFNPFGFDEYFNQSTIAYNFGVEGTAIRTQSFLLEKVIIPHIAPDAIIWLTSTPFDFEYSYLKLLNEKITLDSQMARYYSGDVSNMNLEELIDTFFLKISRLYKYRGIFMPEWLNSELKAQIENFDRKYSRGYIRLFETINISTSNFKVIISKKEFDTIAGNKFIDIINLCEDKKINYLVVIQPHYFTYIYYNYTAQLFQQLPTKNFLNLNNLNSTFHHEKLYYNINHLNVYGAWLFTRLVAKKFELINNKT